MPILIDQVMEAWYAWELRGRGWEVWPAAVQLEPPFRPFLFHAPFGAAPVLDDGRTVSGFDALVERISGLFQPSVPPSRYFEITEPEPDYIEETSPLSELQVVLPQDTKIPIAAAEQFLIAAPGPVAFEVIGTAETITVQFACKDRERSRLAAQLAAYIPDAVLSDADGFLERHWKLGHESLVVEFGLGAEFMRPLRVLADRDGDVLATIVAALSTLRRGEVALIQVLTEKTRHAWIESIRRCVSNGQGGAFFSDAPDMLPLAREKTGRPLFATVIRIAVQSDNATRKHDIMRGVAAALQHLSRPDSNELIPLANTDYPEGDHEEDVIARRCRRSGMLLNLDELVSLVHVPSPAVRNPKLVRQIRHTKAVPQIAVGHDLLLGENIHAGEIRPVTVSSELRQRHLHIVGATGTGKSTFLLNLILQDLAAGRGLAVLDPHGDVVEEILGRVPTSRVDDVVLIDPADVARPVGFNPLQAHSEHERTLLLSDLVAVFRRLSTTWGDQMHSVLANAIAAVLESETGGTLADLRRFLVEPEFRRRFLSTVRDPEIVYYWTKEFPLLTGRPHASLLTRLDTFLRPKLIRGMVTQSQGIDLGSLMNDGKIILIKLAQGAIGEENATLLGSLFVTKFNQLAIARHEHRPDERRLFTLYVDEFGHFVTPSMASLLTGARKFGLGLVLAHQELRQLWNQDRDVAAAVLANAGVRVCFRVGDEDAKHLAEGLGEFTADDLRNLATGEAICRIERSDWSCNLRTLPVESVDAEAARARREQVIAGSNARYGGQPYDPALNFVTEPPRPRPRNSPNGDPGPVETAILLPPSLPQLPETVLPTFRHASTPGRGGRRHKYLQQLVASLAQERGWKTTIEAPNGAGSIDVALERDERRIAFQISVTTAPEYEVEAMHKILAAGFERVLLVATEPRTRQKVADLLEALAPIERERVLVIPPEDIPITLEHLGLPVVKETVTRGYRVRVKASSARPGESPARTIAKTVLDALTRLGSSGKDPNGKEP
jgi:hypothetical protein